VQPQTSKTKSQRTSLATQKKGYREEWAVPLYYKTPILLIVKFGKCLVGDRVKKSSMQKGKIPKMDI
jgi:hypothetical protein